MSNRQLPRRLPRVLTVAEVEALINAAQNPFEKAVAEVLYSTGVRVGELVNLRVENVDFDRRTILVKKGKGGKDRYVPFGSHAAKAMQDYWGWRRPEAGFLFERKRWNGYLRIDGPSWFGTFPVKGRYRQVCLGPTERLKTKAEAREALDCLLAATPGYKQRPAGAYTEVAIRNVLHRMAWRAAIGRVHPHSLRRAFACHMLSRGADVRSIQEFLGHTNLSTTMLYTRLTPDELKAVHERCHPHEQGGRDDKDA